MNFKYFHSIVLQLIHIKSLIVKRYIQLIDLRQSIRLTKILAPGCVKKNSNCIQFLMTLPEISLQSLFNGGNYKIRMIFLILG